ncbi:MAG: hypothetical protein QM605_00775, partial [Sphingobium sp.]
MTNKAEERIARHREMAERMIRSYEVGYKTRTLEVPVPYVSPAPGAKTFIPPMGIEIPMQVVVKSE